MKLTLKEQERLIIFDIAEIARRRWARGLKLNYIEANAIICDEILERSRAGTNTLAELIQIGSQIITEEDVMEDTAELIPMIQLEAMFQDGNKLVTVHNPVRLQKKSEAINKEDLLSCNY